MHVAVEIGGEALGGGGQPRVFGECAVVERIVIGQRERPGAARLDRDGLDVEAASVPAASSGSSSRLPSCSFSTVTTVFCAACAIVASSRSRPIQTLPSRSASGAWNSATSGLSAGSSTIGSWLPNGLSMTFQSGRCASTSEPISPRSGMNGTPFSAAWNAACSAGQVASLRRIAPALTAAVKRGAGPNSPRLTAEVSSVSMQPAPISRSACRLEVGSATSVSRRRRGGSAPASPPSRRPTRRAAPPARSRR